MQESRRKGRKKVQKECGKRSKEEKGRQRKEKRVEQRRGSAGKMELRTVKSKTDVQLDESDRW